MSQKGAHVKRAAEAPKKRKKKKTLGRVLLVVLIVLVVLAAVAVGVFFHFYGLLNTGGSDVNVSAVPSAAPSAPPAETPDITDPEPTETPEPTPEPLTEEELAALEELRLRESLQADAEEIMYNENVYNILLLGADGTSDVVERSDTMILLSINKETKKMWLTSLMRDTQVAITNPDGSFWGTGHLNWTTQFGGVSMTVATVESQRNFAIHIDNWALVNFVDFARVAELLGPITVTITAEEAAGMNRLVREVARMTDALYGLSEENSTPRVYFPTQGGTLTISNGIQILAYCRERKSAVGTDHYGDTGRSNKQREVLMKMWENVKHMSLAQQVRVAEEIMSIITTDLTPGQCASLLLSAPSFIGYEINQQQCPVEGAMVKTRDESNLSIYSADWNVNRNFLRATIYNEPLTARELTSYWTGVGVQVYDPEQEN